MAIILSEINNSKILEIIAYAENFPNLSRRNLANTICENLRRETPTGSLKVNSCLKILSDPEKRGKVKLKPLEKRVHKPKALKQEKDLFDITDKVDINDSINNYSVFLKQVVEESLHTEWNDLIQRYHYLGYKKLFGLNIKYFIYLNEVPDPVGCISFTCSTTYRQKDRDNWIGWTNEQRVKNLNWVLNNNRMLIFPWIKIQNLGSKSLSIALLKIANDWEVKFKFKPLLVETYVDPSQFTGAMYKASNFIQIGQSSGNYRVDGISLPKEKQVKKGIYVFPLDPDYKHFLSDKPKITSKKRTTNHLDACLKKFQNNKEELDLWEKIQYEIGLICKRIDMSELKQSRQINALTMILAIYRIVFANNFRSYDSVLCDLIDNANAHGIKLSFRQKLLPTTFCEARKRFKAETFKEINSRVDTTTKISPSKKTFSNIKKKHPEIEELELFPLRMMKLPYWQGNLLYWVDDYRQKLLSQIALMPITLVGDMKNFTRR